MWGAILMIARYAGISSLLPSGEGARRADEGRASQELRARRSSLRLSLTRRASRADLSRWERLGGSDRRVLVGRFVLDDFGFGTGETGGVIVASLLRCRGRAAALTGRSLLRRRLARARLATVVALVGALLRKRVAFRIELDELVLGCGSVRGCGGLAFEHGI